MHTNHYGDNMTKTNRPRFNPEFKVECAQLVLDQGYSVREAAEAMNVGKSTLDKWVRKLKAERGGELTTGKPITEDQREIAELKRQIKRLEMEKDILKKASALLMSDSMNGLRQSENLREPEASRTCAKYFRCIAVVIIIGTVERKTLSLRKLSSQQK